jgi:hypothetical protein
VLTGERCSRIPGFPGSLRGRACKRGEKSVHESKGEAVTDEI